MVVPCPEPRYKQVEPCSGRRPDCDALSNAAPNLDARGFHCRHSFRPSLLRRSPRKLTPLTALRDHRLRPRISTLSENDLIESPLVLAYTNLADFLLNLRDLFRSPRFPTKMICSYGDGRLGCKHSSNGTSGPLGAPANP